MTPEGWVYLAGELGAGLLLILVGLLCWYFSVVLNRRFLRRNPNHRPYAWGYFNALIALVLGGAGATLLFFQSMNEGDDLPRGFYYSVVFIFLGFLMYRRNRWGWIVAIIVSLNPITWLINGIYVKNRWQEMKLKGNRVTMSERWRSKAFRVWVFSGISWVIGGFLFVLLAEPYSNGGLGDMESEDNRHMLGVMLLPPLFFGGMWLGYKRFVK